MGHCFNCGCKDKSIFFYLETLHLLFLKNPIFVFNYSLVMNTWSLFLRSYPKNIKFYILLLSGLTSILLFSKFMIWNETRPGLRIHDPILSLITPVDLSLATGILTDLPIMLGLVFITKKPSNTIYLIFAMIGICCFRAMTLYFFVLEPPVDIIPLKDPILESVFYGGSVLLKDLFFSGHTANLILIGLLIEQVWLKRFLLFCAFLVGTMLILQHVHYSIDVFAAPFFAIVIYKISIYLGNKTILHDMSEGKRPNTLMYGLGFKNV